MMDSKLLINSKHSQRAVRRIGQNIVFTGEHVVDAASASTGGTADAAAAQVSGAAAAQVSGAAAAQVSGAAAAQVSGATVPAPAADAAADAAQVSGAAASAAQAACVSKGYVYSARPNQVLSIPRTAIVGNESQARTEMRFTKMLLEARFKVTAIEARHVDEQGTRIASLKIAFESQFYRDAAIHFLRTRPECIGTKVSPCDAQQITVRIVERVGAFDFYCQNIVNVPCAVSFACLSYF